LKKLKLELLQLRRDKIKYKVIMPIFSIVVALIIWEFVVRMGFVPEFYLPLPSQMGTLFLVKLHDTRPEGTTILVNIFSSLSVSLSGFLFAVFIGIPLGWFMGWYKAIDKFVMPIFEIIRPIPPIAWIPLTILLFGIGFQARVFIIFFAAFVPCVMNAYTGIKLTNKTLINVAKTCGGTNYQIFKKVTIPSSLPIAFAGIRIALQASWAALVAAEMLASNAGLGFMIMMGRRFARPDLIVLGMTIIGIIGALLAVILAKLEKKLVKHRR